jgi:phospholipase C
VPPAQLQPFAIDHVFNPKVISLSFIQSKLNDFVNNRESDPLKIIRLDNSGRFGSAMPASYADIKSIDANPPPPPRTVEPLDFNMGVTYDSSPMDLGQIRAAHSFGDLYFQDINSDSITANVTGNTETPFEVIVTFETNGPDETVGGNWNSVSGMKFTSFFIRILLTLRFNEDKGYVDLMAWVDDYQNLVYTAVGADATKVTGSFLGQTIDETLPNEFLDTFQQDLIGSVLHVGLTADSDFAGSLQKNIREQLYSRLTTPDPITLASPRDALNAMISSWFMGGVVQIGHAAPVEYPNPNRLIAAAVTDGNLVLNYIGPPFSFVYDTPGNWPKGVDFTPGTLANIDHIVVLTMENRSFDHMLGYLSLPETMGGQNRQDVDGLKGGEFNLVSGVPARIFRFQPGETIFTPDPPHDTEPAIQAINGGLMDGFAQNYADLRGREVGPNIMGYHTADTVPVYDSLWRDFAIGHRWFAPHPGPTFCNRFYEMTGRLNVDPWGYWEFSNSSPLLPVFQDTIFDHLTEQKGSWTYFEHFYCFLRFFERHTYDTTNIVSFLDPEFGFVNMAKTGNLPSVSFIDPHFIELPPDGNCDGPPADVKNGQTLVETVVNAVVSGPKWDKTLLIITYDEHGGFYDHVPPSPAPAVSPELFDFTGIRVPVFVITPWVKNGSVFGHDGSVQTGGGIGTVGNDGDVSNNLILQQQSFHFDHTSILKTIARRFMSNNPPYMGARYAAAHDLSEVLTNTAQNSQFLPFIPYTMVYHSLNLTLDVASLILDPATPALEQNFRFEDAGGGFFYIRALGNLYLTVEVPTGASTGPGTSLTVAAAAKLSPASGLQRWKMSSSSMIVENTAFTVSPESFPDKALQPFGNNAGAGAAIVVADRAHTPHSKPPTRGPSLPRCSQPAE